MKRTVLFLSDAEVPTAWTEALLRSGFEVKRCASELEVRGSSGADVVLIRSEQITSLRDLKENSEAPVILIRPSLASDLAALARAVGVSDYLREPISAEDIVSSVEACVADSAARGDRPLLFEGERLVGGSQGMDTVRRMLASVAGTDCNILITGETGTGKELAAELVHLNSHRRPRNFVCINCAAIPDTLLESELFGYEKGAFTGAHNSRPGQLELADGGTLFLDEIGEMSLAAQAKILRAIDSKEVQRLGRRTGIRVDVRIVCATNRDLEAEVHRGTFRADLFFRVNVARVRLPALRERKEDIPELVEHALAQLNRRLGSKVRGFTEHSWKSLLQYDWPGNVRELRNIVETSLVQLPYARMRLMELPEEFQKKVAVAPSAPSEPERLLAALVSHNWNKSKAARHLSWSRMRLYRKMAQYQLRSGSQAKQQNASLAG